MKYKKLVNELLEKHDYLKIKDICYGVLAFQDTRMNNLANKHMFGCNRTLEILNMTAIDWNSYQRRHDCKRDMKDSLNLNLWNYKKLYELMLVHINLKQNKLWDFMAENWLYDAHLD